MNRFSFFLGASLLVAAVGCGEDDSTLAPGSTVINGATETIEVTSSGLTPFTVQTGNASALGDQRTPVTAQRMGGSDPVTIASGGGRQDVFVSGASDPLDVTPLVAGSMTQLYQRVSGQTLELSVSVDGGTSTDFGAQSFTPNSEPLEVPLATSTYVVNVQSRDVTFDNAADIRFLLVVEAASDDADAYVVYGVKPGSAGVEAEVVRGTAAR